MGTVPVVSEEPPTRTERAVAQRDYEGTAIVVHWISERCIHSERCFRGAPGTFDPRARPWVQPDGTTVDELARVIDTCPSGALSYTRIDGGAHGRRGWTDEAERAEAIAADEGAEPETQHGAEDETAEAAVRVTPRADGPVLIEGQVQLTAPDGTVTTANRLFLCRCGQSASKPACDGSHKRVGFEADGVPVERKPEAG